MANFSSVKLPDNTIAGVKAQLIPYGECDSTSTATTFTATVPGITKLEHGTLMLLKNGVITSEANFTININGLGAKPSYTNLAAATSDETLFNVNYTMLFIYDEERVSGGCWVCYRGYDSKLEVAAVTSGTTYYPIVGTGTTAATRQFDTTGLKYTGTDASGFTTGIAALELGSASTKQGKLTLYGTGAYAATLAPTALTAARTLTVPDATGTIALTSDLPTAATLTKEGIVSTSEQWFSGQKGFYRPVIYGRSNIPAIWFNSNTEGVESSPIARILAEPTKGIRFFNFSYDSSTSEQNEYYEYFKLPLPDPDRTNNTDYEILTSKQAVTIAQGGTGATDAATAMTNLGNLVKDLSPSSSFTSTSAAFTIEDGMNYSLLDFLGRAGDSYNVSLIVPVANISTSAVNYELVGSNGYFAFSLKRSGRDIIMTYVSQSGSSNSRVSKIFGINSLNLIS